MSYMDYTLHEQAKLAQAFGGNTSSALASMASIGASVWGQQKLSREFTAAAHMLRRAGMTFEKPAFNLPATQIGSKIVSITEAISLAKPYGDLLHFKRDTKRNDPKVLLVAPMSGHYATLLRGTVEALLPHHDVYITDWKNARDVSPSHGDFGLDTYAQYIEEFLDHLGPDTHVVAVCQPTVPVLAAISQMAARKSTNQPISMTLMGGPIDARAAPTEVTKFGAQKSLHWFEENALSVVPHGYTARGEKVYPGFKQLTGFLMMNPERHKKSHWEMFNHLRMGDKESADKISGFYNEYLAVMDIAARFYLETVDQVFQRHLLAKGEMVLNGEAVNPAHIRRTALLTVEGERDDIAAPGQTVAAHNLCANLHPSKKFHYLQERAGHYGIFEGGRWREEIAPRLTSFIRQQGVDNHLKYDEILANTRLIPPNFWPISGAKVNAPLALQK